MCHFQRAAADSAVARQLKLDIILQLLFTFDDHALNTVSLPWENGFVRH